MSPRLSGVVLFGLLAGGFSSGSAQHRQIRVTVTVAAPPATVWPLWTTEEGVRSFFAPGGRIDLRVEGAYELFFAPNAPAGSRGAEGTRLLAVEPNRRLAFTWNAPETLVYVREQRTVVSVDLTPVGADSTQVTLRHFGFGSGPEWDEAIGYFEIAWNAHVMPLFKYRMEHGPVNWAAYPKVAPIHRKAIELLSAEAR